MWALSNTTQNSSPPQFEMLVQRQALKALSACLSFAESKVLIVCMEGIENILKAGDKNFLNANNENTFALEFEVCGGVD